VAHDLVEPANLDAVVPHPQRVGRGRKGIPDLFKAISQHARATDAPLIVDITPTGNLQRFRKFSVLEHHDGFARVVVHVPTARAADSDNNVATCSGRYRTMQAMRVSAFSSTYENSVRDGLHHYEALLLLCRAIKSHYFQRTLRGM
jgi:hypothetical protein